MIKIKADENLPLESCALFRNAGYDAHSVYEERLQGSADDSVHAACINESRVLITLDLDFSDIRRYRPESSPGIIVLRLSVQDKQRVLEKLSLLIEMMKEESVAGKLWIVEDDRIRIRE